MVAAALVAAAPAFAQRASLADRVAALEQRASDTRGGNVDQLNQLNQLRQEVVSLRSQVEELQQQNEQLRAVSRDQYLDIDGRLERLEGGGTRPALSDPSDDDAAQAGGSADLPVAPPPVRDPAAARAPLAAQDPDERGAYETAFDALREGRYEQSVDLFRAFLRDYPDGGFAPNALYWLGESYYVSQEYARAQSQFEALIQRFPEDSRAPGALLKVGLSQYGRQDLDAAEATLADVVSRYPGTDAARTADDRLRAIRLARLR